MSVAVTALEETRNLARVVVYGRPGCHLCEAVVAVVSRVCAETGDSWTEIDVDSEQDGYEELADLFSEEVPVTFVDGRQHDFWRVDETRLRTALANS